MKKLLAAGCCILALQTYSQATTGNENIQTGKKFLLKAIAVIVNAEANRKLPPKRISVPGLESPQA